MTTGGTGFSSRDNAATTPSKKSRRNNRNSGKKGLFGTDVEGDGSAVSGEIWQAQRGQHFHCEKNDKGNADLNCDNGIDQEFRGQEAEVTTTSMTTTEMTTTTTTTTDEDDPRLAESWNVFWEENWKRVVYSTWIEKYYRHIDLAPLKEFLTLEGVEIAWEKYEKLAGTDSGFDEETPPPLTTTTTTTTDNGSIATRDGSEGKRKEEEIKTLSVSEPRKEKESSVTEKKSFDLEVSAGSVGTKGHDDEYEAKVEAAREIKFLC